MRTALRGGGRRVTRASHGGRSNAHEPKSEPPRRRPALPAPSPRSGPGRRGAGGPGRLGATGQGTTPEASQSRAPVTLEHVDWWGPTTPVLTTFFDGIKKDFEAKSPNVTVNYTFVQGGTTGVREKWVVNTAGGTPHDSSQVSVAFIRELMDGNLMEPLDPYIQKAPGMALSNFVELGAVLQHLPGEALRPPLRRPVDERDRLQHGPLPRRRNSIRPRSSPGRGRSTSSSTPLAG